MIEFADFVIHSRKVTMPISTHHRPRRPIHLDELVMLFFMRFVSGFVAAVAST